MNQLPAHLQRFQAPDVGAALSQNLGSAMPPHVSIEGGRFTLVDASNNEVPVATFDPKIGVYLDAVVIDVNEHMSRMYYIKDYDPSAAGTPPDCWSDNGLAASVGATSVPLLLPPHLRAGQPAATCAECPMAVWGSKISNLGSKIPACSQKQKTALLVPGFQTLFLLAVPPNSHKFLREYVERCRGSGVNLADVITRISFVPGVQGTLQFSPVNYIDEPTAVLRQAAYIEKKTDVLVGRNDVPRQAALAAPIQQVITHPARAEEFISQIGNVPLTANAQRMAANFESTITAGPAAAFQQPAVQPTGLGAETDAGRALARARQAAGLPIYDQQVQQPAPFVLTPAQNVANPGQLMMNPAPIAATTSLSEPVPTPRRRRRTATEMQAAQPGQQAPAATQAAPQAPFPVSQQPGALPGQLDAFPAGPAGVTPQSQPQFGMAQGQPATANPDVSQMLDNFFKGQ